MSVIGTFRRRVHGVVVAFQWRHSGVCHDRHGVELTASEARLITNAGAFNIRDGDWIVSDTDGRQWVVERAVFDSLYELVGDDAGTVAP